MLFKGSEFGLVRDHAEIVSLQVFVGDVLPGHFAKYCSATRVVVLARENSDFTETRRYRSKIPCRGREFMRVLVLR